MSESQTTRIADRPRKTDSERIEEMSLMDDFMMSRVFDSNIEATEQVLKIILERDDLTVKEVVAQREIKSTAGRSVRLDILAEDTEGKNYDIGKLMHDFRCKDPEEMYFDVLAKRVGYFKNNERGYKTMGNSIEDIYQEGREDGLIEGRIEGTHNVARAMLANGLDSETIMKYSGLSAEEVEQLVRGDNSKYKTESVE